VNLHDDKVDVPGRSTASRIASARQSMPTALMPAKGSSNERTTSTLSFDIGCSISRSGALEMDQPTQEL
jgi:hypothetical protein